MTQADPADPFGTAALRDGTLLAWRSSPTRLREDTATESDLVRAGYRDRVRDVGLTTLAGLALVRFRADLVGPAHAQHLLGWQVHRELRLERAYEGRNPPIGGSPRSSRRSRVHATGRSGRSVERMMARTSPHQRSSPPLPRSSSATSASTA